MEDRQNNLIENCVGAARVENTVKNISMLQSGLTKTPWKMNKNSNLGALKTKKKT